MALKHAWELLVLEKCVSFPNLSVASEHVGLSQPQISRIIKKIEESFEIELLDRSSRKHSHWTPKALKLAEEIRRLNRDFEERLLILQSKNTQNKIRIGSLEGIAPLASDLAHQLLLSDASDEIELNIYDLNELSEHFMKNELDLIFTSRELGRRKFPIWRLLGYQSLDVLGPSKASILAESPSEEKSLKIGRGTTQPPKRFISNSLVLRRYWIDQFGASGRVPSALIKASRSSAQNKGLEPVFILGWHRLRGKADEIIMNFDPFHSKN
jgi:DNA-binding transcriptional LysR family regulator